MQEIKRMDIKEFRRKGYLQEINRMFLHPLGLALEINLNVDGSETLGGIWDYREDKEGIYFDVANSDEERLEWFKEKAQFVKDEFLNRYDDREDKLGWVIEPVLDEDE